jgi:hypothetical protein
MGSPLVLSMTAITASAVPQRKWTSVDMTVLRALGSWGMLYPHGNPPEADARVTTGLQAARREFGWSQAKLIAELRARARAEGTELGSDVSLKTEVSRHENGRVRPDADWRRLYRLVYGRTDKELDFPDPQPAADSEATEELAARLAASQVLAHGDVQLMQRQVDHIRALDRRLGAPAVLEQLRALMSAITGLMTYSLRPQVREPLAAVLADAGALAGWQALDIGAVGQAWQHYELAKTAAREAGAPVLLAHAMWEQAFALLDLGQAPLAVDLIHEARASVDVIGPPLLTAWLHAAEAEAHAACGNDVDCRRALDAATATLPADTSDPALPFIFLSEAHLARWRGNCLARVGDPCAIEDLTAALGGMDPSFIRAEASLRCDLARALIICSELDEAQAQARQARQLAMRVGSVRQRRRIERLSSILAA